MKWKFWKREREFECQRCGNCCKTQRGGLSVSEDDLMRWKTEGRDDILMHINMLVSENKEKLLSIKGNQWDTENQEVMFAVLWFKSEDVYLECPFLKRTEKYECSIYETRPEDCKRFPIDENGLPNKNLSYMCPGIRKFYSII